MDTATQGNIASMFDADTPELTGKIKSMAEFIAVEDEAVTDMDKRLKERKANLDALKGDLCQLMMSAGMDSCKLDNGLTPKTRVQVKYFSNLPLDSIDLHGWLEQHQLGGIIKRTVNFGTLSSAMKDFVDAGNELDETVFQRSETPTITLYGKSKFLAGRNADTPAA